MRLVRVAALSILAVGVPLIVACGSLGGTGAEASFNCHCHESEDGSTDHTMFVCAENEHAAVAAAKKCHGTASNAECSCAADKNPCRPGGCR